MKNRSDLLFLCCPLFPCVFSCPIYFVSCENDVANAMALLVMNVFYIGSIEGDPTYSNLVDREIDTYLYDEKFGKS